VSKHHSGRLSSTANPTGTLLPSMVSYSEYELNGTSQRFSRPSQRRQCLGQSEDIGALPEGLQSRMFS
jgi:hypothetical protein